MRDPNSHQKRIENNDYNYKVRIIVNLINGQKKEQFNQIYINIKLSICWTQQLVAKIRNYLK